MNTDSIRDICMKLPHVTEGIKWGNDLCFMIGGKMFCVVALIEPIKVSIKVTTEEFDELTILPGIVPAPYVAKHKWILIENTGIFNKIKWSFYIEQSYNLVKSKLPKKVRDQLT